MTLGEAIRIGVALVVGYVLGRGHEWIVWTHRIEAERRRLAATWKGIGGA